MYDLSCDEIQGTQNGGKPVPLLATLSRISVSNALRIELAAVPLIQGLTGNTLADERQRFISPGKP